MRRHVAMIMGAFFIILIAMNTVAPLRATAQTGTVTISGQVTYQPRNWNAQIGNWALGKEIQVDLYEKDLQGVDHFLARTYTTNTGNFIFPPITNWWGPDNRQLNVFLKIVTAYLDTAVTDRLFRQYAFASSTVFLSRDGAWPINFQLTSGWLGYQAMWIFEDLRNAWNYVSTYDAPHNPGVVTAVWERFLDCYPITLPDFPTICNSFTYGGSVPPHFIFISNLSILSSDTVVHETGHMYVDNANNWWYTGCLTHSMFTAYGVNCAWSEGWADFFPLAVNGDQCYDYTQNPCQGVVNQQYYDLEMHSRKDNQQYFAWGDGVEGRVAAALYDLYDINSDSPYDRISAGFLPIAQIALGNSQTTTFQSFWNRWKNSSGKNEFLSGLTLWWNTINYVTIRQILLPIIMK